MSARANSPAAMLLPDANGQQALPFRLTGSQAKTAYALRHNIERMIVGNAKRHMEWRDIEGNMRRVWVTDAPENLHCVAFLTLTVGDLETIAEKQLDGFTRRRERFVQVFEAAEASRRINNLNRRVLAELFERAVVVTERHKNGAVHFHVVGILRGRPNIRDGFDFKAVAERDYRSASPALRALWEHLRDVLPRYGFGRSELTPIRSTGEAVAAYVSKYIEKNICNRLIEDKRKKLVRYIGWNKSQLKPNDFSWGTARSIAWRTRARQLAALVGITDKEQMSNVFGPRWGFLVTELMNKVHNWQPGDLFRIKWESWQLRERVRMELSRLNSRFAREMDGAKARFAELGREFPEQFGARLIYTAPVVPEFMRN